jgi:hypothetical protein
MAFHLEQRRFGSEVEDARDVLDRRAAGDRQRGSVGGQPDSQARRRRQIERPQGNAGVGIVHADRGDRRRVQPP